MDMNVVAQLSGEERLHLGKVNYTGKTGEIPAQKKSLLKVLKN